MNAKRFWGTLAAFLSCIVAFGGVYKLASALKDDEKKNSSSGTEVCEHVYGDDYVCDVCGEERPGTEGLAYALSDDGESYILTGIGTSMERAIYIPSSYNGKPVTAIQDTAFSNVNYITSVEMSDSITVCEPTSFSNCSNLKRVILSNNITDLSFPTFEDCPALDYVLLPEHLAQLEGPVFISCSKLRVVEFRGNELEMASESLFTDCPSLEYIVVPDEVVGPYSNILSTYEEKFIIKSEYGNYEDYQNSVAVAVFALDEAAQEGDELPSEDEVTQEHSEVPPEVFGENVVGSSSVDDGWTNVY